MGKKFYLPHSDEGKMTWLNNLASKLPNHAATLGINSEIVTSVQNEAAMFTYMINLVNSFKAGQAERVGYKDIIKNAPEGTAIGPVPVFNNTPPPTVIPAGIFIRVRRLVQNIKSNSNYNESIGNDLGVISAELDRSTLEMKPVLKIKMVAGKPEIIWKKGNADSMDLYVDRNDGKSFVFLANDANPNYTDNTQLSESMNMNEWKYKGIFRIKDEEVGEFSDEISVIVKKELA